MKKNKSKKNLDNIHRIKASDPKKSQIAIHQDCEKPNLFNLILLIKPNAREDRLYKEGEHFCMNISATPVKGKANIAIIKFLSAKLKITKSAIRLIRGHTASTKTFILDIPNCTIEELELDLVK